MTASLNSLQGLIESRAYRYGHFKEFVKSLLRQLTLQTQSERAILWLYQPSRNSIRNYCVYSHLDDAYYSNDVILEREHPFFFQLIIGNVLTTIGDISSWENLKDLADSYYRPYNIHSMLGMQIWNKGNLFGFLFLESNKRAKNWQNEDQVLLANASSLISQGYDNSITRRERKFLEEHTPDFNTIFNDIPIPIWIFDPGNYQILEANELAAKICGYEGDEFQSLSLRHLLQDTELIHLDEENQTAGEIWNKHNWTLKHKNGSKIHSQVKSTHTVYCGESARLAVITEITRERKGVKEQQRLEQKLADHAFYTSHYVRGPLANILGLMDLIKLSWEDRENYEDLIYRLKIQIMNLDEAIRVMSAKVELD